MKDKLRSEFRSLGAWTLMFDPGSRDFRVINKLRSNLKDANQRGDELIDIFGHLDHANKCKSREWNEKEEELQKKIWVLEQNISHWRFQYECSVGDSRLHLENYVLGLDQCQHLEREDLKDFATWELQVWYRKGQHELCKLFDNINNGPIFPVIDEDDAPKKQGASIALESIPVEQMPYYPCEEGEDVA